MNLSKYYILWWRITDIAHNSTSVGRVFFAGRNTCIRFLVS